MRGMPRIIIESPYAANMANCPPDYVEGYAREDWRQEQVIHNLTYLRSCMRDSILFYKETPYASHALLTQEGVLDDQIPEELELGIKAGFEWRLAASHTVFYLDFGFSRGMHYGLQDCLMRNHPFYYRAFLDGGASYRKRPKSFLLKVDKVGENVSVNAISLPGGYVTRSTLEESVSLLTEINRERIQNERDRLQSTEWPSGTPGDLPEGS